MSTSSNNLQFPILTFWTRFHFTGGGQSPIELKIIEKTNETFKSISPQPNNLDGFIEDPKELEATGFFQALSVLTEEELKTPDALNYTYDFKNPKQVIGQNSNHSTKEVSPLRRSERIAKLKLAEKTLLSSIK